MTRAKDKSNTRTYLISVRPAFSAMVTGDGAHVQQPFPFPAGCSRLNWRATARNGNHDTTTTGNPKTGPA